VAIGNSPCFVAVLTVSVERVRCYRSLAGGIFGWLNGRFGPVSGYRQPLVDERSPLSWASPPSGAWHQPSGD